MHDAARLNNHYYKPTVIVIFLLSAALNRTDDLTWLLSIAVVFLLLQSRLRHAAKLVALIAKNHFTKVMFFSLFVAVTSVHVGPSMCGISWPRPSVLQ